MAMLFDVLTRPIVVATGANVMRFEDAISDGVYSVTIAPGTYDTLAALLLEVQVKVTAESAAHGLNLDWTFAVTLNVNDYRPSISITHTGVASAFIRLSDPLHTLPNFFGLAGLSVVIGIAGLTYQHSSEYLWVSPQPVYSVDEDPSEVDVLEMVTPSGRSFRAKNSDVRRLRALSLRNLPRDRMLKAGAFISPLSSLESFWERTIIEDWRRYHPELATYPALEALASGNFVGAYRWTGGALTGFNFRRASVQRVPLYDVDLACREVVP